MTNNVFELKKGEFLFHEGDLSTDLYVIQEGLVKVYKETKDGKLIPLSVLQSGSFIGELSFFDGSPRSATAEVASDTVKVLKLTPDQLQGDIGQFPSWLISIIKSITERIRDANALQAKNEIVDETLAASFRKFDLKEDDSGENEKSKH